MSGSVFLAVRVGFGGADAVGGCGCDVSSAGFGPARGAARRVWRKAWYAALSNVNAAPRRERASSALGRRDRAWRGRW